MADAFPAKLQAEFRDDFIKHTKRDAWEISCIIAYFEKKCADTQQEIKRLTKEADDIEVKIKALDPELAHGDERKNRQDQIKDSNGRLQQIALTINGSLRPNGVLPDGRQRMAGKPGLTDMVMHYMQIMNEKRAEAQEKLAIAEFAASFDLK
jgi:hypothetical protein